MSPRLSDVVLRSQSDERLVSLARQGHDRAFAAIVQRYRPELLALARRLNSDGRAEDVLQQALLSAFASLRSGAEVRHLRGWLYQIVRNAATKAVPSADVPLDGVAIEAQPLEEVVQQRARAMSAMTELARLPERQRIALVGTALAGRPHVDVAVAMGVSEQAVRQLVHRARTTLRGAVTVVTPWPLARWLAASPPGAANAPEIAVAAGTISSTGVAVKLGALFAATGALATGIAVGPIHPGSRPSVSRAATTHTHRGPSVDAHRAARPVSRVALASARPTPAAPVRASASRHEAAPARATPRVSSRGPSRALSTASAGRAATTTPVVRGRDDSTSPTLHRGSGPSEGQRGPGESPSGPAGAGHDDGHGDGGAAAQTSGGSDGGESPTAVGVSPSVPESSGDGSSGHDGTASLSDDGGGNTVASSTPTAGPSVDSGSDGDTSGSEQGGSDHADGSR